VRGLMQTTINLRPDQTAGELRIELHGQANPTHDAAPVAGRSRKEDEFGVRWR
jgi:hypothetical protein